MRINKVETLITEKLLKMYISSQKNVGQKVEKELEKFHKKILVEIQNKGW